MKSNCMFIILFQIAMKPIAIFVVSLEKQQEKLRHFTWIKFRQRLLKKLLQRQMILKAIQVLAI